MGMRTRKITKLALSDFLKENPKPIQQKKTERENYMRVVSWEKMAMLTNGLEIRILAMLPNGLEIWIQAMLPNGLQQSSALAAKHVLEGSGRERCFAKRWFSKWSLGFITPYNWGLIGPLKIFHFVQYFAAARIFFFFKPVAMYLVFGDNFGARSELIYFLSINILKYDNKYVSTDIMLSWYENFLSCGTFQYVLKI